MRIRAHNLLCLIGFEGCGYSEKFVENMTAIKKALWKDPFTSVEILTSPDDICAACPNLKEGACHLRNRPNEEEMKRQDLDVAGRLKLEAGKSYTFKDLMGRIRDRIDPSDLNSICGSCLWLPSGVCAKAISGVKALF